MGERVQGPFGVKLLPEYIDNVNVDTYLETYIVWQLSKLCNLEAVIIQR